MEVSAIVADYLSLKIFAISSILLRVGFGTCWQVGHITPVSKSYSMNTCLSEDHAVTITPFLSILECLLVKHPNYSL